MEKCHETSDTAECTPTHYEWNKEIKRPASKVLHDLMATSISDQTQTFIFPKFVLACKKLVEAKLTILQWEWPSPFLNHIHPQIIKSIIFFWRIGIPMQKKIRSIYQFFLEITFLSLKFIWSKNDALEIKLDSNLHIYAVMTTSSS